MTKRRAHYVLSTHWDREWYQAFQDYRYRLVTLFNGLLDGFESGTLRGPFTCDGQAILFEDFLEVHPEKRAEIEQLSRDGKFVVGPWYVLPDEFLVTGESMVRNLRLGREIARAFGTEPSNAGFACDLFGHVSQLPQIFRGFGIETGFLWRGVNNGWRGNLIWEGADGSELTCYKFTRNGYCDYAFEVREAGLPNAEFDAQRTRDRLERFLQNESDNTDVTPLLLFDGGDHQEWDRPVYDILCERMDAGKKDYEVVHSTLDAYGAEMLKDRAKIKARFKGELRQPSIRSMESGHTIHGVLASRIWIKQQNAFCQDLLTRWAEPFAAFASQALGSEYPQGFLNVAWRWLLKNHPHDSICGCSIDQVHEDMKFRFSQTRQIGERLTAVATNAIAASIQGEIADEEIRVVLFNPATVPHEGTTEFDVEVPKDSPTFAEFFGYEPKPGFRIYDEQGTEIPYQRLRQETDRKKTRLWPAKFPQEHRINRIRVSLPVSIPAMGYTTLTVRPAKPGEPTRHPASNGLATAHNMMGNEYLEVFVTPNGCVALLDKETEQIYEDLLTYEDQADIGDGWFHGPPVNDQAYVSTGTGAAIALIEDGPNVAAFRIRQKMLVPREFDFKDMVRSEELVEMEIDTVIRLRPGARHLDVETTIHNNAGDHRVRVLFPTAVQGETFLTDSAFDVVERNIALAADNYQYNELDVEVRPMLTWAAISDEERGMAIVSTGQFEVAVRDQSECPLALTLFRSTRRTVLTDGEPEGQLLGPLHFRYRLIPFAGAADRVGLFRSAEGLANGLRTVTQRRADQKIHATGASLPPSAGFLTVDGSAVLSSARMVGDALEVRLFNPNTKAGKATVSWPDKPKSVKAWGKVELVDLESKPLKDTKPVLKAGKVSVSLKPKQIVTLRLS